MLGVDPARIGGVLAERWHFPSVICNAIAAHHTTEDTSTEHLGPLALAVCLENALAHCGSRHQETEARRQYVYGLPWEKANLVGIDGEKALAAIEGEQEFLCGILIDNAGIEQ